MARTTRPGKGRRHRAARHRAALVILGAALATMVLATTAACGTSDEGDLAELRGLSTPGAAIAHFGTGPTASFAGGEVDADLLRALRADWPDDGVALGKALRAATAGDVVTRDRAAEVATQMVRIVAEEGGVPERARSDVAAVLASYAADIVRITASTTPAGAGDLDVSTDQVAAAIDKLSNDDPAATALVLAGLVFQRQQTYAAALEAVTRANGQPLGTGTLHADPGFLDAVTASGRATGKALAFAVEHTGATTAQVSGAIAASDATVFAARAEDLADPLVGERLGALLTAVQATADVHQKPDRALAMQVYDTLLRTGYLRAGAEGGLAIPEGAVETGPQGVPRIKPAVFNDSDGDVDDVVADAFETWQHTFAPKDLASPAITGWAGLDKAAEEETEDEGD